MNVVSAVKQHNARRHTRPVADDDIKDVSLYVRTSRADLCRTHALCPQETPCERKTSRLMFCLRIIYVLFLKHGDSLFGKSGNVREFDSCQGTDRKSGKFNDKSCQGKLTSHLAISLFGSIMQTCLLYC